MAEIDGSNPLTPVWPQRPVRRIEDTDRAQDERQREQQRERQQDKEEKKDNDDGSPHIDEYA